MGKKKRPNSAVNTEQVMPVFFAKKKKLMEEVHLTALVALHKYCHKFKLGNPGFRQKNHNPFVITVVMDNSEFGTGHHKDKDKAMEQAALTTLHLLDPDGKSIVANISHSHEGELKTLCEAIQHAKHDEVKVKMMTPQLVPNARMMGGFPFAPALPAPPPNPYAAQLYLTGGMGHMVPPATAPAVHQAAPIVPLAPSSVAAAAPLPPVAPLAPVPLPRPLTADGLELVWTDEASSIEEVRARLPKYSPKSVLEEDVDGDAIDAPTAATNASAAGNGPALD